MPRRFIPVFLCAFLLLSASISAQDFKPSFLSYDATGRDTKGDAVAFDYDGDGDEDVLVGYEVLGSLLLYRNTGVGFENEVIATSYQGIHNLATGDFNNDGLPDYVAVYKSSRTWYTGLFVNQGGGSYQHQLLKTGGADNADKLIVRDMDNDGDLDLILDSEERIGIFYYIQNLGNLNFSYENIEFEGFPAHLIAVGDVDNDGLVDVVGASYKSKIRSYEIAVVEQDPSVSDHWVVHPIDSIEGLNMEGQVADFTGNGRAEVLLGPAAPNTSTAQLFELDTDFSVLKVKRFSVASNARFHLAQDYDADGDMDVMLSSGSGNSLYVNDGKGVLTQSSLTVAGIAGAKQWIDFNGDGNKDLLTAGYSDIEVLLFEEGKGYQRYWKNHSEGAENILLVDFDGNQKPDVLSSRFGTWSWSSQTLKDQLRPMQSIEIRDRTVDNALYTEPVPYDYDNDGDLDFLTTQDQYPVWLENDKGAIKVVEATVPDDKVFHHFKMGDFDQDGNPDFINLRFDMNIYEWQNGKLNEKVLPAGSRQYDVLDVDNDGDEDIIYVRWNSSASTGMLSYLENDKGNFTSIDLMSLASLTSTAVTNNESSMEVYDINNDGYVDVFLLSYDDNKVVQLLNNGDGTFRGAVLASDVSQPSDVAFADMNNDGYPDILALSRLYGRVHYYRNDSNKGYTHRVISSLAGNPLQMKVGDFDDDGDIDVFTCSQMQHTILWVENLLLDCERSYSERNDTICARDSFLFKGKYYKATGLLSDTLPGASCDSVVLQHLYQKPEVVKPLEVEDTLATLKGVLGPISWYKDDQKLDLEKDTVINMKKYGSGIYRAEFEQEGCSASSESYTFSPTHLPFGVQDLAFFPNPVRHVLTFSGELPKGASYQIFDQYGRRVDAGLLQRSIAVVELPNGIYFIEVRSQQRCSRVRFVKQ